MIIWVWVAIGIIALLLTAPTVLRKPPDEEE